MTATPSFKKLTPTRYKVTVPSVGSATFDVLGPTEKFPNRHNFTCLVGNAWHLAPGGLEKIRRVLQKHLG